MKKFGFILGIIAIILMSYQVITGNSDMVLFEQAWNWIGSHLWLVIPSAIISLIFQGICFLGRNK